MSQPQTPRIAGSPQSQPLRTDLRRTEFLGHFARAATGPDLPTSGTNHKQPRDVTRSPATNYLFLENSAWTAQNSWKRSKFEVTPSIALSCPKCSRMHEELHKRGYQPAETPLGEFVKAGARTKCLPSASTAKKGSLEKLNRLAIAGKSP